MKVVLTRDELGLPEPRESGVTKPTIDGLRRIQKYKRMLKTKTSDSLDRKYRHRLRKARSALDRESRRCTHRIRKKFARIQFDLTCFSREYLSEKGGNDE